MAIDRGIITNSWAFSKALARGVWDAGSNMVKGLGELAKSGYQLATDASARESAWQTSKQLTEMAQAYGQEVIEDPGKVYRDAADGVSTLYQHYEQAKSEAEAQGRTAEFYGEMTGEAGFEVGSLLVPLGLASKAGKLGKATDTLADTAAAANKIENIDEAFAAAQRAEHTALNPAISELDDKISPIQKCPDMEQATKLKPLPGLHNRDDLAVETITRFNTIRKVDMANLSEADEIAKKALKKQGWEKEKIQELLESAHHFRIKELQKGDKLYGFNSKGRGKDIKKSSYWLDEAGFNEVKNKFYKQGRWDKEGIKNHLALPCYNRADAIDRVELTESHLLVESTIGRATENILYQGADGYNTGLLGKIMRGGGTQVTDDPTKIKAITGL